MMEDKKTYLANREWSKDLKFNGHWYHLQSLFDLIYDLQDSYDFNKVYDAKFDFNDLINDGGDNINGYQYHNQELDVFEFGRNIEDLLEIDKRGTSIIDADMSFDTKFVNGLSNATEFIKFYNRINNRSGKARPFQLKTMLLVEDGQHNFMINYDNIDKSGIFNTLLKNGGGFFNEGMIKLILLQVNTRANDDLDYTTAIRDNNSFLTIFADKNFNVINTANAYSFPDATYYKNNIIPIDLKVNYNGGQNAASGSNKNYMSGIHAALMNIINKNMGCTLIEYIQNARADLDKDKLYLNIPNNNLVMPELKGFLLVSITSLDGNQLVFNDFKIHSIIDMLGGNGYLFSSKEGQGEGSIQYRTTTGARIKNNNANYIGTLLEGAPNRFASVVDNFYQLDYNTIIKYLKPVYDKSYDKDENKLQDDILKIKNNINPKRSDD